MGQIDTASRDRELNRRIQQGDLLGAFEDFYAPDVAMREGAAEPTAGKDANRRREEEFVGSVEQVHGVQLLGEAAGGDRSYSEWMFDITFKDGSRAAWQQVAARRWRDGQIVEETFYRAG